MAEYGMKISEAGTSIHSADESELVFSSKYEPLKVFKVGSVSVSLPEEVLAEEVKEYSGTSAHNLSYIPFYQPSAQNVVNGSFDTEDDFILNNYYSFVPQLAGYGPATEGEWASLSITSTNVVLRVTRSAPGVGAITFGEHDVICYYTVFYQRADAELDLS